MNTKQEYLVRVTSLIVVFVAIFGCTNKNLDKVVGDGPAYIKAIYALPRSLDPVQMNDTISLAVSNLIYEGLLRFNSHLDFEGALAESWTSDQSGKLFTFKLRPNLKFHDGSPITPESVVSSLTRTVAPNSTVYKYYDCIVGAEEYFAGKAKSVSGLRTDSSDKVIIELKYPFPPFLSILAGATAKILPTDVDTSKDFFQHPVGSGPFKLVEIKKSSNNKPSEMVLERFSGYQGFLPKIGKLILRVLTQDEALLAAAKGEVSDLANFPLVGIEEVFKIGQDVSSPVAATWIIGFNLRKSPFKQLNIRRAFKQSVNSEEFRKKFYPDAHQAFGYVPMGLPGHLSAINPSASLLIKVPPHSKITVAFPELLTNQLEMRTFLEKMLRSQGWNVSFVPMSWDKIMEGYDKKTLQGFVLSMNMDYPDTEFLVRNFESKNPDNFSGLADSKIEVLIRKARETQDRLARTALYEKIVQRLEELAVTVNLFHPRAHNWVHSCVKNFEPNILADYYIDYRKVEIDSACLAKYDRGNL
jgi:ABC-type transport system substrate-binding protein